MPDIESGDAIQFEPSGVLISTGFRLTEILTQFHLEDAEREILKTDRRAIFAASKALSKSRERLVELHAELAEIMALLVEMTAIIDVDDRPDSEVEAMTAEQVIELRNNLRDHRPTAAAAMMRARRAAKQLRSALSHTLPLVITVDNNLVENG